MPPTVPASPRPPFDGDSYRIQQNPAGRYPVIAVPPGRGGHAKCSPRNHRQPTP